MVGWKLLFKFGSKIKMQLVFPRVWFISVVSIWWTYKDHPTNYGCNVGLTCLCVGISYNLFNNLTHNECYTIRMIDALRQKREERQTEIMPNMTRVEREDNSDREKWQNVQFSVSNLWKEKRLKFERLKYRREREKEERKIRRWQNVEWFTIGERGNFLGCPFTSFLSRHHLVLFEHFQI